MPRRDPVPSPTGMLKRRFWRIFRLLVPLAIVIAAIAAILVSRGDPTLHIHMIIATAVGIFTLVLVGTSLMSLLFLSNSSGHDETVANFHEENEKE